MEDPKRRRTVWGTCAGMILLSNQVLQQKTGGQLMVKKKIRENYSRNFKFLVSCSFQLGGVDITTGRNFFGRQKKSFEQSLILHNGMKKLEQTDVFHGVFIRAPGVISIDNQNQVQILATLGYSGEDRDVVAVKQDNLIVTSFHPELTDDLRFHEYFVDCILENLGHKSI